MLRLIEWAARNRILVCALVLTLLVFGTAKLRTMPVDVLPEFAPPMVEVQTEALGLSASEVESLITTQSRGIAQRRALAERSVPVGDRVVVVQHDVRRGTDIMRARQMIQERLTLAYTLPNVSKAAGDAAAGIGDEPRIMIGLTSKTLSLIQQSVIAQWNIKPKLLGVPGVANVAIWGERRRQLQVQVEPTSCARMASLRSGVTRPAAIRCGSRSSASSSRRCRAPADGSTARSSGSRSAMCCRCRRRRSGKVNVDGQRHCASVTSRRWWSSIRC